MKKIFRQARKSSGIELETHTNNATTNYGYNYDASITNHHIFVFGDLNFRVQLSLPTKNKEIHFDKVLKLIQNKDWEVLSKYDELNKAVQNGDCCANFKTLPCPFPPTFKLERKGGFHYKMQRTPR